MKKIFVFALLIIVSLLNYYKIELFSQGRDTELTAKEILARVDKIFQYPRGLLKGAIMHVYPSGKKFTLQIKANIAEEDFLFVFSNKARGNQIKILYNLGGEDIWVYNILTIKLFNKKDIDKYEPLLNTNFNFSDFSNADLQSNYNADIKGETVVKGKLAYKLELDPIFKKEKDLLDNKKSRLNFIRRYGHGEYGKLTLYVTKKDYIPLRIDFHDQDKVILKTMSIAQMGHFNKRMFPVRYDMLNIKKGTLTILKFFDVDAKREFDKNIFRHQNLGEK